MSVVLIFGLSVILYIIFVAWVHYAISSGERGWAKDKEKYLTNLRWLGKGYYGVRLED